MSELSQYAGILRRDFLSLQGTVVATCGHTAVSLLMFYHFKARSQWPVIPSLFPNKAHMKGSFVSVPFYEAAILSNCTLAQLSYGYLAEGPGRLR